MMGTHEVVRETVSLTDFDRFVFTSDFARKWVEHPEEFLRDAYPLRKVADSIRKHGFIPNFPDVTYHAEAFYDFPLSLILIENKDGKLSVPGGHHRMSAARFAGLKKIGCYVKREKKYVDQQLEEFRQAVAYMNQHENCRYQSWRLPGGHHLNGRDDSGKMFDSFNVVWSAFTGRTVLDIACNTGYFAIKAGLLGAEEISGFDVTHEAINAANMIAKAFRSRCRYDFRVCEFWDYPFDREYDIVFCNQALYHFTSRHRSKCLGSIDDMLDRIAKVTGRTLLMYTYVDVEDPPSKDGGYYPSSQQLIADLTRRGFRKVLINQVYGPKKHVVAIKEYENLVASSPIWREEP